MKQLKWTECYVQTMARPRQGTVRRRPHLHAAGREGDSPSSLPPALGSWQTVGLSRHVFVFGTTLGEFSAFTFGSIFSSKLAQQDDSFLTHVLAAHREVSLKSGNRHRPFPYLFPKVSSFPMFSSEKMFLSGYCPFTLQWPQATWEGFHGLEATVCKEETSLDPGSVQRKSSRQAAAHHRRHVPNLHYAVGPTRHHQAPGNVHGHMRDVVLSFMKCC